MRDSFKQSDSSSCYTTKQRNAVDAFKMHSLVTLEIRDKDGNLKHYEESTNLRTNAGADFWNKQLFGAASATAVAKWLGITTDATAAAAGDTTLTSEETTNGLARMVADTVTHSASATQTVIAATWTYSAAVSKVIAKAGLFDAISAGNLVLETVLSATGTVNAVGDTIKVTWTINF